MCYNKHMFRHGRRPQSEATTSLPPSEAEVVHTRDWHELASMYFLRARQDHDELSGLLVDIDATKPTNDELGHEVGNYLIDTVHGLTAFIPKQVRHDETGNRSTDVVTSRSSEPPELRVPGLQLPEPQTARIGGDEFGILLPHTGIEGALAVKERLTKALDEWLDMPEHRRLKELGVGISVGIAAVDADMKNASDFLRAMDQSMYKNKIAQLPELSAEAQAEFVLAIQHLKNARVRPRDVPKYLQKYDSGELVKAFETTDKIGGNRSRGSARLGRFVAKLFK